MGNIRNRIYYNFLFRFYTFGDVRENSKIREIRILVVYLKSVSPFHSEKEEKKLDIIPIVLYQISSWTILSSLLGCHHGGALAGGSLIIRQGLRG